VFYNGGQETDSRQGILGLPAPTKEETVKASVFYIVQTWVSPKEGKLFLNWLRGGHIAEVLREPGFLWARQYRLEELDDRGWAAYMSIYGLDAIDSLNSYFNSSARERFFRESEQFKNLHRDRRFHGILDLDLPSPSDSWENKTEVIYCICFSVSTKSQRALLEWLDKKYIVEFTSQSGSLWACRLRLEGCNEDGWMSYMIVSGHSSRHTLEEYLNHPTCKRFFQEWQSFASDLRMEKFLGSVEFTLDRDSFSEPQS